MKNIDFLHSSEISVLDMQLKGSLRTATNRFRLSRAGAVSGIKEWEELRNSAREIKKHTIENLDSYLLQLEESINMAGGKVHWAADAEEATDIITKIAVDNNVKTVVKSKSMATEEIELNEAFGKAGIESVETDLGEYILQLAEEPPSHIIAPAIHKTKNDISELFALKFNIPRQEEPEILAGIARKKLRNRFLESDMGVSGVNFAAADTGTIVLVENEGNARLSTTVPKIHVALMGIEKIVPEFGQLSIFLSLLARSATGQKSSTYVSFITGPKRRNEDDGPEQFHLVLLDNGRTGIIANERTRESLYCLRCGACLNICPVYRQVGGHSYGSVYSGPIGAVITPQLTGLRRAHELPYASSLCGACKDVCPVKIDFPRVLLELRKNIKNHSELQNTVKNKLERYSFILWKYVARSPFLYKVAGKLGYYLQKPFEKSGYITKLPSPFSGWTKYRDFPSIAKRSFRDIWEDIEREK